jgi:hypothetical protein
VPAAQTVVVPYSWHLPVPSHLPLVLQLLAPLSVQVAEGSAPPAVTGLQVPALPATAQDMQVPVQVVAQQTPCWQRLVAHSDPDEHEVPFGFNEQLPALHTVGETQSASALHVVLQLFIVVASHTRLPGQLPGVTVLQVPAPSQVAAGVSTDPVQLAGAHCVPLGQLRQCPAPSQRPSVAQPEAAVIVHWVSVAGAWPAGMGEQVPAEPLSAHDRQVPVQAELQQTPCAQKPDTQDEAVVQGAPGGSLPQLPLVQTFGATQSALVVQVTLQAPAPHPNGSHICVVVVRQAPAPSQVRAGVSVDPVHEAAPQLVPAG